MIRAAGVVFRGWDRKKTAKFYAKLGLIVMEHQHGGPLHFTVTPIAKEFVVEIYDASEKFPRDAIMLEVDSLKKTLRRIKKLGIEPITTILEKGKFIFVYLMDPDGRDVLLIEKAKKEKKEKPKRK